MVELFDDRVYFKHLGWRQSEGPTALLMERVQVRPYEQLSDQMNLTNLGCSASRVTLIGVAWESRGADETLRESITVLEAISNESSGSFPLFFDKQSVEH